MVADSSRNSAGRDRKAGSSHTARVTGSDCTRSRTGRPARNGTAVRGIRYLRKLVAAIGNVRGIDQDKLLTAIARGLQNQDGRARSDISEILSSPELSADSSLLPVVLQAVETPAPSGEMFADGVRVNGLKVLASHHIKEGMQAAADYLRTQNPWASEHRTPEILEVFDHYGAEAQVVIPHLKETAAMFDDGEENFRCT